MDIAGLCSRFEDAVDAFAELKARVKRARDLADKFNPLVVETVCADLEQRALEAVGAIVLLQTDAESLAGSLRSKRDGIEKGVAATRLAMEELDLRVAIGAMDDGDYEKEASAYKSELKAADDQVAELDEQLLMLEDQLGRWQEVGEAAGVLKAA